MGGILGFAEGLIKNAQDKKAAERQFQQQQWENQQNAALNAASLALTNTQNTAGSLANTATQQTADSDQKWREWNAKNPTPSFGAPHQYRAWLSRALSFARSIGREDIAKDLESGYRTGEQAEEFGSITDFNKGPRSALTTAQTGLTNARTKFELAHAINESGLFNHQLQMEREKGQTTLQQAYIRANAIVAASANRISSALQIAQLNNSTRVAIAQATAMNMANGKSDQEALQLALADYKNKSTEYIKNQALAARGQAPQGFDPSAPAPTLQESQQQFSPSSMPAVNNTFYFPQIGANGQPTVTSQTAVNNTQKNPLYVRVHFPDEVKHTARLLSEGTQISDIADAYAKANVDPMIARKIIANATAIVRAQKTAPRQARPVAAPAPAQSGNFLQNMYNQIAPIFTQ
jgi:hypothetical protein